MHNTSAGSRRSTYCAAIIGHGLICSASGRPTRYHTSDGACRAAIKIKRGMLKQET